MAQPFKVHQILAAIAAARAGVELPEAPPELGRRGHLAPERDWLSACSALAYGNEAARTIRDGLWEDLERRLGDTNSWTLAAICGWVNDLVERDLPGVDGGITISSAHRARVTVLEGEKAIELRAKLARGVIDAAGAGGETDVFTGSRILAGQLIFEALSALPVDALDALEPHQVVRLMETLGKLSRAHAATQIDEAKLAEMRAAFDEQMTKARSRSGGDGNITEEMISEVREAVFGSAA